jgi:hypothetical protein
MGDVLSSGVFWTAVGSVAAVIAAIAAVVGLRARGGGGVSASAGVASVDGARMKDQAHTTATREPPLAVSFGEGWGKMTLPVRARIGVIDKSDALELGLSAMQLDNIGHTGKYNAVVVAYLEKKARAAVFNAFGMRAMEGSEIRISSALARHLGCNVGEELLVESLAVISE